MLRAESRVLLVDGHPLMREGIRRHLDGEPGIVVCGEADGVADGYSLINRCRPDLVILEICLPDGNGLDLIARFPSVDERFKALVYSSYEESYYAERALGVGAMGYVSKRAVPQKLLSAIRVVLAGQCYLSRSMTSRFLNHVVGRPRPPSLSPIERLTNRELEVFRLIGSGFTTREVAEQLGLSVHTIETHRGNIKEKLDLKNGAALSRQATQWVLESSGPLVLETTGEP